MNPKEIVERIRAIYQVQGMASRFDITDDEAESIIAAAYLEHDKEG